MSEFSYCKDCRKFKSITAFKTYILKNKDGEKIIECAKRCKECWKKCNAFMAEKYEDWETELKVGATFWDGCIPHRFSLSRLIIPLGKRGE